MLGIRGMKRKDGVGGYRYVPVGGDNVVSMDDEQPYGDVGLSRRDSGRVAELCGGCAGGGVRSAVSGDVVRGGGGDDGNHCGGCGDGGNMAELCCVERPADERRKGFPTGR